MDDQARARERVLQIARAHLNGQITLIEAARAMLPSVHRFPDMISEHDYNFLRAIDSETDTLPLGNVRNLWNLDALIEKDHEIARCEELWGTAFQATCERIVLALQSVQ